MNNKKISLYVYSKNGLVYWNNLTLKQDKKDSFYYIFSDRDSINLNKRQAYRLDIFKEGFIEFFDEDGKSIFNKTLMLKDISVAGFAFISKEFLDDNFLNAKLKTLKFNDGRLSFLANFSIVRNIEENEKIVYGCKFDKNTKISSLEKYIVEEQIKRLKKEKRD